MPLAGAIHLICHQAQSSRALAGDVAVDNPLRTFREPTCRAAQFWLKCVILYVQENDLIRRVAYATPQCTSVARKCGRCRSLFGRRRCTSEDGSPRNAFADVASGREVARWHDTAEDVAAAWLYARQEPDFRGSRDQRSGCQARRSRPGHESGTSRRG